MSRVYANGDKEYCAPEIAQMAAYCGKSKGGGKGGMRWFGGTR